MTIAVDWDIMNQTMKQSFVWVQTVAEESARNRKIVRLMEEFRDNTINI